MEQVKLLSYYELEEENRELKIMLSKLAHEMGNALTLLGASIYYVEANITSKNVNCDISDLKNDYTYICNLFKELREYNQSDIIVKKEITVGEMISAIERAFARMKGSDDVSLIIYKQDNMLDKNIYADLVMLRQALINILKNSIDAVEENEDSKGKKIEIKIWVENISDCEIEDFGQENISEVVHIEVADNGKGIGDRYISEIFKPMFTYGKKDGTGLGLSIVKKIVEKHKGKIKAVSVQGTGTAIHIYFPILI